MQTILMILTTANDRGGRVMGAIIVVLVVGVITRITAKKEKNNNKEN